MKALARRVDALEVRAPDTYAHLADAELKDRMLVIVEELDANGFALPGDWRSRFEFDAMALAGEVLRELRFAI